METDHSEFIKQMCRQLTSYISKKNLSQIDMDSLEIISCANHWQRDNSFTNDDKKGVVQLLNICANNFRRTPSQIFLPGIYYLSFIDGFDGDVIKLTHKNSTAINSDEELYSTVVFAGVAYLKRSSDGGVYLPWPKMVDLRNFAKVKKFAMANYHSKLVNALDEQLNSGKITGDDIAKFYIDLPADMQLGILI